MPHHPWKHDIGSCLHSLVGCSLGPQLDTVTLGPDVDGNTADLLTLSELLANAGQNLWD